MRQALSRCWYGDCPLLHRWLLGLFYPLALLFRVVLEARRQLYRIGWFRAWRLPVPVIVVGNITAGGTGKTPLVLALIDWLRQAGCAPGVISRGYGGRAGGPKAVRPESDPAVVGDEPVLVARRALCPVWVGRSRAEAGRRLLAEHPEVDVIIADDGLQHYALARDVELAVVDGERGFGNGRLLPAGPLREPVSRLRHVDAIVVNGGERRMPAWQTTAAPRYAMTLRAGKWVNLAHPERRVDDSHFLGRRVHALAGIGHPERFFSLLGRMGFNFAPHAFPDHHAFRSTDMPEGVVLMTEKDAVKCAAFPREDAWYLAVDAEVEGGLKTLLLNILKDRNGSQAA